MNNRDMDQYDVFVSKDSFKFTAAHFIAFKGFRERIHGHNYTVAVRLRGKRGADGYVVDFGNIKKLLTKLCKQLNQRVLLPAKSDVLEIKRCAVPSNDPLDSETTLSSGTPAEQNVQVRCEDGAFFSFPASDALLLPIVHTSAEDLAEYLLNELISQFAEDFSGDYLMEARGVSCIELSVSEAPNQTATCTRIFRKLANQVATEESASEPQSKKQRLPEPCTTKNGH